MSYDLRLDPEDQTVHSVGARRLNTALRAIAEDPAGSLEAIGSAQNLDVQQTILLANLCALKGLHSTLVQRRLESGLSSAEFGERTGLSELAVSQFESRPWEATLATALIYLMGVGIATRVEIDSNKSWGLVKTRSPVDGYLPTRATSVQLAQ